jgi:hypothetical protein
VRDPGEAVGFEVRARIELSAQQPGSATAVAAVIPPVTSVIAAVLAPVTPIIAPVTTPLATPEQAGPIASLSEQSHLSCSFHLVLTIRFDRGDQRLGWDPAVPQQLSA